ncbi:MAG: hypothetical protein U0V04_17885 [Spirosomataceae bacterium]
MGNFESQYEKVSLLRNEEVYKIYDFEQGRGFMPDFLLFLKQKEKNLYYQIFIEPKGDQFKDAQGNFFGSKEGWKEIFMQQISQKYGQEPYLKAENKDFILYGLPLYNKKNEIAPRLEAQMKRWGLRFEYLIGVNNRIEGKL